MLLPHQASLARNAGHRLVGTNRSTSSPARGCVKVWQFRTPRTQAATEGLPPGRYRREPRLARVEAVLFLGREPLPSRKIAQLADLADGTEARTLIRRLQRLYEAAGSPLQVAEVAGGYQLLTRPELASW